MADLDLCYMSAREALKRFHDKSLSPVELMQAMIDRADEVEPQINAFAFRFNDEAMKQAKAAEDVYAGKGSHEPRLLEGLPMAVKDESGIAGQPLTNASLVWKDEIADSTSIVNQRLLDEGAIVHARTRVESAPQGHRGTRGAARDSARCRRPAGSRDGLLCWSRSSGWQYLGRSWACPGACSCVREMISTRLALCLPTL